MKWTRHLLALLLALVMMVPAIAEEDEWSFIDLSGEMIITYDAVAWNFPVDFMDMEPELVIMINKSPILKLLRMLGYYTSKVNNK